MVAEGSAGGGGGAARATILTPRWRKVPSGELEEAVVGEQEEDLSDEAFLRRHEPLALDERRRWSVAPAQAPKPEKDNVSKKRSRTPAPPAPLFPTPLACFLGVNKMMDWWAKEAEAQRVLQTNRLKRRRSAYGQALVAVMDQYDTMELELQKQKARVAKLLEESVEKANAAVDPPVNWNRNFLDSGQALRLPLDAFDKSDAILKKYKRAAEKVIQDALSDVEPANLPNPPPPLPLNDNGSANFSLSPNANVNTATPGPRDETKEPGVNPASSSGAPSGASRTRDESIMRFAPPESYALDGCNKPGAPPGRFPAVMTLLKSSP